MKKKNKNKTTTTNNNNNSNSFLGDSIFKVKNIEWKDFRWAVI